MGKAGGSPVQLVVIRVNLILSDISASPFYYRPNTPAWGDIYYTFCSAFSHKTFSVMLNK